MLASLISLALSVAATVAAMSREPYLGVPARGVRSPCPALNTLANHGILPNDGKGITAKSLRIAYQTMGFDDTFAMLNTAVAIERYGSPNSMGILSFDLNSLNNYGTVLKKQDTSLTRIDSSFDDMATIDFGKMNRLLASVENGISLTATDLAAALTKEFRHSFLQNPDFSENFNLNSAFVNFQNAAPTTPFFRHFLVEERFPPNWEPANPPITIEMIFKTATHISKLVPDKIALYIFDLPGALSYIATLFSPVILSTVWLAHYLEPILASFPKPKKLVFYAINSITETIAFLSICVYFIPQTFHSVTNGGFYAPSQPDITYRVMLGAGFSYIFNYTAELVFSGNEMHFMLKLHHLSAIGLGIIGLLLIFSISDILMQFFVFWTGAIVMLHAVIDAVPHVYLGLRQMKAPTPVISFFAFLSLWPLSLFRLAVNVFYVALVRHFALDVVYEVTPLFIGWSILVSAVLVVIGVTQIWAHNIYVAIQKKDRYAKGHANLNNSSSFLVSQE
ncbi:hypothetical protein BDR26DRAFT_1003711 [Obelidium mucronatum]|nr:hypothetical protein BDR26DRAFT_1003711 [Obelidium mucronatum]